MGGGIEKRSIVKGVYRHTKSDRLYEVVGSACHTESGEVLVIYRPLYESEYELFARPYDMFMGTVLIAGRSVARFTLAEGYQA